MTSPWSRTSDDSWFKIGLLEVSSTLLLIGLGLMSWILYVVSPSLSLTLALSASSVYSGEVWRLVTWPMADAPSFWSALNLLMLWFFGTDLERNIGRVRMLRLYLSLATVMTVATLLVGLFLPAGLAGLSGLEFLVLLLWVAEYPRRPFFFSIPAWIIGLVLLGIQVMGLMAGRAWGLLLALLLSLFLAAVVAKRQGLLGDYAWVPGGPAARKVRPARPTPAQRAQERAASRSAADRARLDVLLDKINETGLHSLTDAERSELVTLRNRLRGD